MSNSFIHTNLLTQAFRGTEGIREVCFIGIGGIGMSALARFFVAQGVKVSGYDKTPSALTRELEQAGIEIHYEEDLTKLAKSADLIVYTPAIPSTHKELTWYRENGYTLWKRSDLLQKITQHSLNICIAGTHGKTTTTTLVAHILRESGFGCNAFLGGIAANYGTNYWGSTTNCCVVEADEYDRSFLKLQPHVALISAMDPDHLDIYGTVEAMEQAFIDFTSLIPSVGLLVYKQGLKRAENLKAPQKLSYHLQDTTADCYAANLEVRAGRYYFQIVLKEQVIGNFELSMGGLHNVENAVGAIAIAYALKIPVEAIAKAIASFKGVQRRFEKVLETDQLVLIDDYAHHPAELTALLKGVRSLYGNTRCTILFQPHLYSRTRDLSSTFAEALSEADRVILLPIYPARELPMEGVSSALIADKMEMGKVQQFNNTALLQWVESEFKKELKPGSKEILILAGAGDIDQLVKPIKEILVKP
jgi:UDP-N-acetylmuramate--alanine ligase